MSETIRIVDFFFSPPDQGVNAHGWRWLMAVLMLGAWMAALLTGSLKGAPGHLLLAGAILMLVFQLIQKPLKTPFELWQQKPRSRRR